MNEKASSSCNHENDYISRQAAIDAYGDWYVEEGTENGFIGTVKQLLEGLPSVQPPARCIAEIKIDKDELEELVAKSMANIAQPEQFNPCIICQEFDCTGCKFRRT